MLKRKMLTIKFYLHFLVILSFDFMISKIFSIPQTTDDDYVQYKFSENLHSYKPFKFSILKAKYLRISIVISS